MVLPGLGNADKDYKELVEQLQSRNMTVRVAQVARYDWLRNAAGLTKKSYWEGTLTPRPTVDWYLERISAAVTEVQAETQGPVCLLAHSAGGWMARVWLAEFGSPDDVHSLVCLGSPLNPPPEETDVLDQTRGILTYVNTNMPGAFHKDVNYVCVTGKFIEGKALKDKDATWTQRITGLGYKQVYGSAAVWGDGITPVPVGQLEGATCVELDGVYHSPLGAAEGRPWYGSEEILGQWVDYLQPSPSSAGATR